MFFLLAGNKGSIVAFEQSINLNERRAAAAADGIARILQLSSFNQGR
jgi:hypothetical protein